MATAVTGFSTPASSAVKVITVRDLTAELAAVTAQLAAANTALAAEKAGHEVIGLDINSKLVSDLNLGKSHVEGISELEIKNAIKNSSLIATELNVCKELRKSLNDYDQIIFDMMINHAMKCENKVPLGFETFLKSKVLSFY